MRAANVEHNAPASLPMSACQVSIGPVTSDG
jgi:hypothetical protein